MESTTETDIVGTTAQSVSLTPTAAERVQRLMEERSVVGHALRVFVSGGGCSGLQYGMALEGQPRETDLRFSQHGVDVVIDPVSIDYLNGAIIDYVDDLMGGGFRIDNPNAVASCGCGHSFRTKDQTGGEAEAGGCNCH
jgi:iron-sulfur cluster assembly accessory protein